MSKQTLGPAALVYPMPATLVGAMVEGKPNYCTIAFCGVVNYRPPTVAIGMNPGHYTASGIVRNGTFSVNIPSIDLVEKTDCCGIASGKSVDKSSLFTTFTGELGTAPMIEECPISLECRVIQSVPLAVDTVFLGEIVQSHVDENVLKDGVPDIQKVNPIVFSILSRSYWTIGEYLAEAYECGKKTRRALREI